MKKKLLKKIEGLKIKLANADSKSEIQSIKILIKNAQNALAIVERNLLCARKWRERNREYFTEYYKAHKQSMIDAVQRYKHTDKGIISVKKYESKPRSKMLRKAYQKKWRERNK